MTFTRTLTRFAETVREPASEETVREVSLKLINDFGPGLGALKEHIEGVGLESTADQINRIEKYLALSPETIEPRQVGSMVEALSHRFEDELNRALIYFVPRDKAAYWRKPQLFGQEVFDRFGSARDDIEEAGNCFTLNRSTAVVFHLMRVLETGLRALAKTLNNPSLDPRRNPSWDAILDKCDKELAKRREERAPEWAADGAFFAAATANLRAVKEAWRNPTMHVERRYDEEEARDVWNATRAFMRHLATKLSEVTTP